MVSSTNIPTNNVPTHVSWLVDTKQPSRTADGRDIEIWELRHQPNNAVLSAWATHFRNQYCLDLDIDTLRGSSTRSDYLTNIKFPDKTSGLGPAVRAGDFGEILVADYLEWCLGYWVPRFRWSSKVVRNESLKGCDIIGLRFQNQDNGASSKDALFVFESKTKFSNSSTNCLQNAINDSAKDHRRLGESLNFIKQKLFDRGDNEEVQKVARFQNPVDAPYEESYGAAAVISDEYFDVSDLTSSDCSSVLDSSSKTAIQPAGNSPDLLVIKGRDMMTLVHDLYQRAANEA